MRDRRSPRQLVDGAPGAAEPSRDVIRRQVGRAGRGRKRVDPVAGRMRRAECATGVREKSGRVSILRWIRYRDPEMGWLLPFTTLIAYMFHDCLQGSLRRVVAVVRSSGSIVREARLRAGLSQVELSERSGKDRAQIARWERDVVMPGFETLVDLVRACGFDLSLDLLPASTESLPVLDATSVLTPKERLDRMLARRSEPLGGAGGR